MRWKPSPPAWPFTLVAAFATLLDAALLYLALAAGPMFVALGADNGISPGDSVFFVGVFGWPVVIALGVIALWACWWMGWRWRLLAVAPLPLIWPVGVWLLSELADRV